MSLYIHILFNSTNYQHSSYASPIQHTNISSITLQHHSLFFLTTHSTKHNHLCTHSSSTHILYKLTLTIPSIMHSLHFTTTHSKLYHSFTNTIYIQSSILTNIHSHHILFVLIRFHHYLKLFNHIHLFTIFIQITHLRGFFKHFSLSTNALQKLFRKYQFNSIHIIHSNCLFNHFFSNALLHFINTLFSTIYSIGSLSLLFMIYNRLPIVLNYLFSQCICQTVSSNVYIC